MKWTDEVSGGTVFCVNITLAAITVVIAGWAVATYLPPYLKHAGENRAALEFIEKSR